MKQLLGNFKNAISWLDILQAKQAKNLTRLNEASLGRAYQHFLKGTKESFVIVTAWRAMESDSDRQRIFSVNKQNMLNLVQDIRGSNLGFIKMRGVGIECTAVDEKGMAVPYENCPQEQKIITGEPSYFVIGATKDQLKEWMEKYNQNAGIYHGPDTDGHTILVLNDGSEVDLGTGFHPSKVSQVYSKIRGKTFVFEYLQQGEGFMEALAFQKYDKYKL